jgi:hypothetical protein
MLDVVFVIIAAVLGASPVQAQPAAGRGLGTASCADFAEQYKGDPRHARMAYESWAQGFMTGMNFESMAPGKPYHDLNAITVDEQFRRIASYCDKHPLGAFVEAVIELYKILPVRAQSKPKQN